MPGPELFIFIIIIIIIVVIVIFKLWLFKFYGDPEKCFFLYISRLKLCDLFFNEARLSLAYIAFEKPHLELKLSLKRPLGSRLPEHKIAHIFSARLRFNSSLQVR